MCYLAFTDSTMKKLLAEKTVIGELGVDFKKLGTRRKA
jgi:hypothetical protein